MTAPRHSRLPVARLPLREAFSSIDWARPWLAPYRVHGEAACAAVLGGATVAQALNALAARQPLQLAAGTLRFVPQAELPAGQAYESFIFRTAGVPTRDHLHDFFNGLVWLAEPALKKQLNEVHAQVLAAEGVQPQRSPARNALTLADESGALLEAPSDAVELLRARRWHELLVRQRARWLPGGDIRLRLIGHALMEQLVQPYKGITAHVWPGVSAQALAAGVSALQPRPFLPLPVLGVPAWWPANAEAAFYDDAAVFRPLPPPSSSPSDASSVRPRPSSLAR
ncbi:DUF3025 domain-containing protein [Azohydromonas caseinilytica]|uniref:DUF3025 domain-containing protein n=1 Tax=Azohydromonas caseinilytica TaxID=2728836 RepID=A0A848FJS6_9BURK|nr:DUF3025 domain-containing protein [Azohydromonas caseinilytica]NML18493.1 DUF3025 domain-containing protein [Azohydromonas caseinilytica]